MGRREDGAAARNGPEIWPRPHRDGAKGKPRRRSMRRRGPEGDVPSRSRAMAGLRSRAIGPGARSWLTGVASSTFSKARPAHRKNAAVERREAPFSSQRRKGTPSQSVPPDGLAGHPQGVSHTPAFPGAPLPSRGAKIWNSQEGLPGADQRMRAISYGWFAKRIEERAARAHSPFVPAKAGIQR